MQTPVSNLRIVLRQLGWLVLAVLVLYAVLLAVSLALVPRQHDFLGMDTGRASASLYLTEPKYVFLGRSALDTTTDKVIMVGASNVVVGFKQPQVQRLMPGAQVHNLGVGGSNMTQVREIVDLVQEVQTPEARRHNTFVVGLWYGLFADDAVRWHTPDRHAGDTDIDIERYRYGFYRRSDAGPEPLLPAKYLDAGATLIHPWLVIDKLTRDATRGLRAHLAGKAQGITDEQRNAVVLSEAEKQRYLDFWTDYMGHKPLGLQQFGELKKLIDSVTANGGKVVLVDLPLPAWHAERSPYFAEYQQRRHDFLASLAPHGDVAVLVLSDGRGPDEDFSDEVHPKPRVTPVWAQQLATALNARDTRTLITQTSYEADDLPDRQGK